MIVHSHHQERDLHAEADICIVGSGASGAVAAHDLAAAGVSVIVIEEGSAVPQEEIRRMKPHEAMRRLYRDYGSVAPIGLGDTPFIPVLVGKTLGGSSVLTGGVIYRTPERIVDGWNREFGLKEVTNRRLEPIFDELDRELPTAETPVSLRSRSTLLFKKGADALNYPMRPIRRNMVDCRGCSQCSFGCPHGAKKSVDMQYIPRSREHGARYFTGFRVRRLIEGAGRLRHVEADFVGAHGRRGVLKVRAKLFLLACGTLFTPALLLANKMGNGSGRVGRNLSIHPSFRSYALFDEEVRGWDGALQSMEMSHFIDEGMTFNAIFVPPSIAACGLPEFGAEGRRAMTRLDRYAMFGGMVEDESVGRVYAGPGGAPVITYRLPRRTKDQMVRTSRILAEVFLAAGAKKVFLSAHSIPPLSSMDDVRRIDPAKVRGKDFEAVAFHPLGTCRIGVDPRVSVVNEFGRSWDVPNLYVIDGSIVPTSIRVNSQMTVMAMAKWATRNILENRKRLLG
jgi:choline dehydrogenase-like flavoprotein